jgi:hypothetical protein
MNFAVMSLGKHSFPFSSIDFIDGLPSKGQNARASVMTRTMGGKDYALRGFQAKWREHD